MDDFYWVADNFYYEWIFKLDEFSVSIDYVHIFSLLIP